MPERYLSTTQILWILLAAWRKIDIPSLLESVLDSVTAWKGTYPGSESFELYSLDVGRHILGFWITWLSISGYQEGIIARAEILWYNGYREKQTQLRMQEPSTLYHHSYIISTMGYHAS